MVGRSLCCDLPDRVLAVSAESSDLGTVPTESTPVDRKG